MQGRTTTAEVVPVLRSRCDSYWCSRLLATCCKLRAGLHDLLLPFVAAACLLAQQQVRPAVRQPNDALVCTLDPALVPPIAQPL